MLEVPKDKSFITRPAVDEVWDNRYIFHHKLGHGSYGDVIKAFDTIDNEFVAIKMMDGGDGLDEEKRKMVKENIFNEIKKMEAMRDSKTMFGKNRIVNYKRSFVKDDRPCIVMECLGVNLKKFTNICFPDGMHPLKVAILGKQLMEGLYFLSRVYNDFGMTHADLKPDNILMTRSQCPGIKLIDFGLSFHAGVEIQNTVQSLPYRAPEVLLNLPFYGAIDMWSAGCIILELITGVRIFKAENEFNLMSKIVKIFGQPPAYLIKESPRWKEYFKMDAQGYFTFRNDNIRPREFPLSAVLRYVLKEEPNEDLVDILSKMFHYDPIIRIRPFEALNHPYFSNCKYSSFEF